MERAAADLYEWRSLTQAYSAGLADPAQTAAMFLALLRERKANERVQFFALARPGRFPWQVPHCSDVVLPPLLSDLCCSVEGPKGPVLIRFDSPLPVSGELGHFLNDNYAVAISETAQSSVTLTAFECSNYAAYEFELAPARSGMLYCAVSGEVGGPSAEVLALRRSGRVKPSPEQQIRSMLENWLNGKILARKGLGARLRPRSIAFDADYFELDWSKLPVSERKLPVIPVVPQLEGIIGTHGDYSTPWEGSISVSFKYGLPLKCALEDAQAVSLTGPYGELSVSFSRQKDVKNLTVELTVNKTTLTEKQKDEYLNFARKAREVLTEELIWTITSKD
ncbi:MAG: hypothetical protein U5N86_08895 [Planctomycetota bacterium]|nr:hypothetical protein [Planctomycetota bacterium]